MQPLIKTENLAKTYHLGRVEVPALRSISLEIGQGEMVAIMGPSGSGKSTFMNLIGCLDRPTSGAYHLEGAPVATLSDDALAEIRNQKIGFVFQTFNLLPRSTALQNVELPLLYRRGAKPREKAMEALERTGIADRAGHRPAELSGGEQQRVAIARALVNDPVILLCDEPTGNLDSRTGEEVIAVFQDLNNQGITLVVVSHDEDIARHGKRIVRFRDGLVVSDKPVVDRLDARAVLAAG